MSIRERRRYLKSLKAGIIQKIVGLCLILMGFATHEISFMAITIPWGLGLMITKKWIIKF